MTTGSSSSSKAIVLGNGGGILASAPGATAAYGGVISGSGRLSIGETINNGTIVLSALNTYTGGTTISAGTLQLGNGGTTGIIFGNVTDNGSLSVNRSDTVSFNSTISGLGNLVQNGSGSTVLGGMNTYTGGTIINNGTFLVNSSQALGLGDVVVNGGALKTDPRPINVKGNYTQNAGGTLQLGIMGSAPGQYGFLDVDFSRNSESGSLAPLQINAKSADSLRTNLGVSASYTATGAR